MIRGDRDKIEIASVGYISISVLSRPTTHFRDCRVCLVAAAAYAATVEFGHVKIAVDADRADGYRACR